MVQRILMEVPLNKRNQISSFQLTQIKPIFFIIVFDVCCLHKSDLYNTSIKINANLNSHFVIFRKFVKNDSPKCSFRRAIVFNLQVNNLHL